MRLPILLAVALTGCATSKTHSYSWGTISIHSQGDTNRICSPVSGEWDNGQKRPKYAEVDGCAEQLEKGCEIHLANTASGAKSLIHELAHCDGVADPEKAGYQWD